MDLIRWSFGRFADLMGWLGISGYAFRITLGFAAGLVWWWYSTRSWLKKSHVVLVPSVTGLGALVAGRLGYVFENALYFQQHPEHITALRRVGGVHGSAALVCGTLTLLLLSRLLKLPRYKVIVCAVPAFLLIAVGAWRASILAGNAIGKPIDSPQGLMHWMVRDVRDLYGSVEPRVAVQHIAALLALTCAIGAMLWQKFSPFWMLIFATGCAALSGMRGDNVPMLGNVRSDTLLWSATILLYLWLTIGLQKKEQYNANTE